MSEGEIAELEMMARAWADPGPVRTAEAVIAGLDDVSAMTAVAAARALPRLLEEREALLRGAKYLVENYPERQATRYMLALKAAIAKAEEP